MYLSIYLTIELATDLSLYLDTNLQSPACIWIEDWRLKIPQKLFPQIFNPPNLRGGLAIRRKNPVESSIWSGKGFHPSTHSIPFHPSVHPSYPSTHTVHPSILSVHLHIYLPSYLFTYLSTNLPTYLSFHPSIYLIHWCCIKISYICQQYCCKISSIWYIYIYAYLKNFIQLGHKKQNILHMHSEKLHNAINGSMSFSQWISERKFNFALLRHAQMIGFCLLLCCRFL